MASNLLAQGFGHSGVLDGFGDGKAKKGWGFAKSYVAAFLIVPECLLIIIQALAMRFSVEKAESRREFFRSAARYGLLGLLAAAGAMAARAPKTAGQRCVNRGICSGCAEFAGCGLPQALSAKQAGG